jgi:hypothetical protein
MGWFTREIQILDLVSCRRLRLRRQCPPEIIRPMAMMTIQYPVSAFRMSLSASAGRQAGWRRDFPIDTMNICVRDQRFHGRSKFKEDRRQ